MLVRGLTGAEAGTGDGLELPEYQRNVRLGDGGIYDNLGLETVFKRCRTIFVSDGGGKLGDEAEPASDWVRETLRTMKVIDNQVRSLRKRHLIDAYQRGDHTGTYWGIRTSFADYKLASDPLGCLTRNPVPLAEVPTRLEKMPRDVQDRLMNWGYAVCDAALRAHIDGALQTKLGVAIGTPGGFPFPGGY
jgi:NTE family protein